MTWCYIPPETDCPSAQEPGVENRPLINADGTPWTGGERAYDAETGRLVQTGLPQIVKATSANWTTPQAHDVTARGSGQKPTSAAGNACLARDAASWPTPASRDHKGENAPEHLVNGTGRKHMDQLPNFVAHGFSLPARQIGMHGALSCEQIRLAHLLLRAAMPKPPRSISRPYSRPSRRKPSNSAREAWRSATSYDRWAKKRRDWWTKQRLSPAFVTWLMGWPRGHALCASSVTAWSRWKLHMRGALSRLPSASAGWIWEPPKPKQKEKPREQLSLF